jgi:hypothetical protein
MLGFAELKTNNITKIKSIGTLTPILLFLKNGLGSEEGFGLAYFGSIALL